MSDIPKITNFSPSVRLYMDPDEQMKDLPSTKDIARMFSMLSCNSHTICDEEEHPIGVLLPATLVTKR